MNNLVLVGRLVNEPKKYRKYVGFQIAVNRNYKNENGIYETDFIRCRAYKNLGESLCNYCIKGDLIGIKGQLQSDEKMLYVNCDKITFLAQHRNNESESEE